MGGLPGGESERLRGWEMGSWEPGEGWAAGERGQGSAGAQRRREKRRE